MLFSRFPFSFVSYFWVLKGKVSSGRGESIPSLPKMFPPLCSESESTCLQGRVVATGRWQCQCLPQLYGRVVYGAWPPSSWEPTAPIIGAPRASMPASLLLHSIICHSESNWGLMGNQSLYNQGSRLLIERLFLVHSLTCPIIILRVIEDCFKRNHFVAIFSAARLVSHPRLGWSAWLLLIRFALETTISRWSHLSSSYF